MFYKCLVIVGPTQSEMDAMEMNEALDNLAEDMLRFANATSTQKNIHRRENQYLQFCDKVKKQPFPVDEDKLIKFALYLSFSMQTVESIKAYCGTICELHELKGLGLVRRTKRYYKTIRVIRQTLGHEV